MKFMNFFDSSEDTSYEVKDPDLLRMQSQNEKLKEALDEANQTVKQIQNVFTAQTVSFEPTTVLFALLGTRFASVFHVAGGVNKTVDRLLVNFTSGRKY